MLIGRNGSCSMAAMLLKPLIVTKSSAVDNKIQTIIQLK
jgi:hypothetical protein